MHWMWTDSKYLLKWCFTEALSNEQTLSTSNISPDNFDRKQFCLPITAIHFVYIWQLIPVEYLFPHTPPLVITMTQHVLIYKMLPTMIIFLEQSVSLRHEALVNSQSQVIKFPVSYKDSRTKPLFLFLKPVSTEVGAANYLIN